MITVKVGIVGAGSAGLFAARQLGLYSQKHKDMKIQITLFDAGPDIGKRHCPQLEEYECAQCDPCNIMSGVGGAGAWSSGILNFNENIGGNLGELCTNVDLTANDVIHDIDSFFVNHGAPDNVFDPHRNESSLEKLKRKATAADARFIPIKQRLLGSENTPKIIKSISDYLKSEFEVKIVPNTKVISFNKYKNLFFKDREKQRFDFLLLAPGRWGMVWLAEQCKKVGIKTAHEALDIGVRVEVPSIIMKDVCEKVQRDPKFHILTPKYKDFIRTFCVNHKGFVVKENYEKNIVGVNGHQITVDGESENTNFAFLIRQELTSPLEDTTEYGRSISKQTSILGGYKPLIQTLGDLKAGHRSRHSTIKRNPIQPTLKDATPGDIAMAYPFRFITDILEGLKILDKIIPGINNDSTLIYAPEFKRSAKRVITTNYLESKQYDNLFFAGDGAGLSRGIVGAAVTGIIAAKGIIKKLDQ